MSSPGILTLILLFVSLHIAVIAEDKHMLCKTVDDIFTVDSVGRSQQITRRLQGPPGKLGPKGPKGDSGPPGPRGQIGRPGADNNQRIDQVEARVAARMDELEREFQMKIDKLNATVWKSTSIKERLCNGMYYRGYCYWAIIPTSQAMNYNEAVRNCSDGSGEPADIVDSMHYNMIFEYVRSLTSLSHALLWLGTTINPKTEIVSLSNGSRASYVKYDKGFPSSISSWTQMAINVDQDLLSTNQRMWNTNPAYYIHGVLCQK